MQSMHVRRMLDTQMRAPLLPQHVVTDEDVAAGERRCAG